MAYFLKFNDRTPEMLGMMPPKSMKMRIVSFIFFICIIISFFIYGKINQPSVNYVNGIYANPCCNNIKLNNGKFYYGNYISDYDIKRNKDGIFVTIPGIIEPDLFIKSSTAISLYFTNEINIVSFVITIDQKEYLFVKNY